MDRQFKTIQEITPREGDFSVGDYFTIREMIQIMKLYADACVGKKLIDMGYKKHVTGDPEGDLAELVMLPWFRENEE